MAQRIDLVDQNGRVKKSIYPGTVFYQKNGDKKIYIDEFVDIKGDTLFMKNDWLAKTELAFIDKKNLNNNCAFVCCTPINYALIPFQFGLTAIIYSLASNGNADFGDEIIPVAVGSYLAALVTRKIVNKIKEQAILSSKYYCQNCSYKFIIGETEPNTNLYK